MKKLLFLISLVSLIFTCNAQEIENLKELSLNVKSFQSSNSKDYSWCLARDEHYNTCEIISFHDKLIDSLENVKISKSGEFFYDNQEIFGTFVLVGIDTYKTQSGYDRTVPVYMRKSNFNSYLTVLKVKYLKSFIGALITTCLIEE